MYFQLGIWDLLKLLIKYISYKIQQFRLATNEYEIVNTSHGRIKGMKRKMAYGLEGTYFAFEGIPYAKPPLGELRFRAPQPAEPWEGILKCTTFKAMPSQRHMIVRIPQGSEDCLYLNIYAKKLRGPKPLPVMIWIYGGGFQVGEATRDVYAPDFFMKKEMVLVTFNYRVGILGFASFNDPDLQIPGNAGLKDQLMALRWIKENIHNFNGDPNNITLFGNSAGSASTHLLMLSPRAKGLFHKAILQSGTAHCPWASTPQRDWAYRLACKIGYKGLNNDKEVHRYLARQRPSRFVVNPAVYLTKQEMMDNFLFPFCPVVEPYDSEDCIISRPIKEYLPTAWSNDIPIIIGGTSFEGLFNYSIIKKHDFMYKEITDCSNLLPQDISKSLTDKELKDMAHRLRSTHFGEKIPGNENTMFEVLDVKSYQNFWHSIHRTIKARQSYAPHSSTYCYMFDFDSSYFNLFRQLNCGPDVRGTSHADDLSYLFHNAIAEKLSLHSLEYECVQKMIAMWYNFALTSNPNCKEIAATPWQPIVSDSQDDIPYKCLNISQELEFKDLPIHDTLRVWDSFYTKENLF